MGCNVNVRFICLPYPPTEVDKTLLLLDQRGYAYLCRCSHSMGHVIIFLMMRISRCWATGLVYPKLVMYQTDQGPPTLKLVSAEQLICIVSPATRGEVPVAYYRSCIKDFILTSGSPVGF